MTTKTKILFIGNCQASAIAGILNLNPDLFDVSIISVHLSFDQNKTLELIKTSDIIITQRVRTSYGNASTLSVLSNKNKTAKVILYNSCYMKLYYFDSKYLVINDKIIDKPCAYHYDSIINSYKQLMTIDDCYYSYIKNKKLLNKDQLIEIFNKDIQELLIRYNNILDMGKNISNIYYIDITKFITDHYKNYLLFYSFNHPSNILLSYIAEKIVKILNMKNTIDNSVIQLNEPKCILYSCLSNIVDFDLTIHRPFIKNETNIKNIIQQYYNTYSNII